jgi:hypothetical protein
MLHNHHILINYFPLGSSIGFLGKIGDVFHKIEYHTSNDTVFLFLFEDV